MAEWKLVPCEPSDAMIEEAKAHACSPYPEDAWDPMLAATPPMPRAEWDLMVERAARAIYDELEGPVNNQDFTRQLRQWEQAKSMAAAALRAALPDLRVEGDE